MTTQICFRCLKLLKHEGIDHSERRTQAPINSDPFLLGRLFVCKELSFRIGENPGNHSSFSFCLIPTVHPSPSPSGKTNLHEIRMSQDWRPEREWGENASSWLRKGFALLNQFARCIKSIACAAQSHWKQKLPNRSDIHVSCPVVELKRVWHRALILWFSCFVQFFCHICCLFGIVQLIPKNARLGRIQLTCASIFLSPIDTTRND